MLEESMQEEQIREALNKHWNASAAGDADAEHDICEDDAICDYPQSGERILGRSNLQALRSHHPGATGIYSEYYGIPPVRSCTRHSISLIPSRRQPGGANGFSASSDAAL